MGKTLNAKHSCVIAAPAGIVYELVADVTRWPVIFGPSVHVEHLERGEREERFRIWAIANGEVKNWTSRRELDRDALRIRFRQERSQPPVASMAGEWEFVALAEERTEVVLRHDFAAVDDAPEAVDWISQALDRNSAAELDALRRVAELGHPLDELIFSFSDSVEIDGEVADAYEFIYRAQQWPQRLPHVRRVSLREEQPGVQEMEMDTLAADGSAHTTTSVRVCLQNEYIVYKQTVVPALLVGHSGQWAFEKTESGSLVTATHTVALNPAALPAALGPEATLAEARAFARNALGGNSRTTLSHTKAFAQARRGTS
jgi:aromatase